MDPLFVLFIFIAAFVCVPLLAAIIRMSKKPARLKDDSYFLHLQLNPQARPAYGDIIFNFTKSQAAIVWTVNNDPNLGVVVLGRVPPAEWKIDDDVRVIGRSTEEAQRSLTPQKNPEPPIG